MATKLQVKFSLRPFKRCDDFDIAKNINNKKIYRHTLRIPYPYSLTDARDYFRRSAVKIKKGETFNWAIVIDGEVAGCVSLEQIVKGHKAELGYWRAR